MKVSAIDRPLKTYHYCISLFYAAIILLLVLKFPILFILLIFVPWNPSNGVPSSLNLLIVFKVSIELVNVLD